MAAVLALYRTVLLAWFGANQAKGDKICVTMGKSRAKFPCCLDVRLKVTNEVGSRADRDEETVGQPLP